MKSATVWFRISAVLLLLFAAGHTFGFLTFRAPTPAGQAVFSSMNDVHFSVDRQTFSYGDFYLGFGLSISVFQLFEAWLAAKELLANPGPLKNPNNEPGGDAFVLKVIGDAKQPSAFRTLALRMLRPDHPKLKLPDLLALTKSGDLDLRAIMPTPATRMSGCELSRPRSKSVVKACIKEIQTKCMSPSSAPSQLPRHPNFIP